MTRTNSTLLSDVAEKENWAAVEGGKISEKKYLPKEILPRHLPSLTVHTHRHARTHPLQFIYLISTPSIPSISTCPSPVFSSPSTRTAQTADSPHRHRHLHPDNPPIYYLVQLPKALPQYPQTPPHSHSVFLVAMSPNTGSCGANIGIRHSAKTLDIAASTGRRVEYCM